MLKVLFGLNQSPNREIENKIRDKYKEVVGERFDYDSEYYIEGIWRALKQNHYDILVLREDLEGIPIKVQLLDDITDNYPDLQIIYIVDDEHHKDNYIKQLFNLGIYNIIYKEDLTLIQIVELMQHPRNKMEAKIYLDIDDIESISETSTMEIINDREIETMFLNLRAAEVEDISAIFDEIAKTYNDKQMLFLISILPKDIKEKLSRSGNKNFEKHYKRWVILDDKYTELGSRKSDEKAPKTKTITRVEEKYIHSIPSDYNKVVAFVGNRQVGSTTVVDLVARVFIKNEKKVSVLDLTKNKTLYYVKCWGDTHISNKEKRSLEYLNKGENYPIPLDTNYRLYTQVEEVENFEFDFFQAVEQIRYDSDVILIDMDFDTPYDWLKYGVTSVYLVNDLNILNMMTVKDYIRKLIKHGVNSKKINLIINKYVKAKVKPEDILACINQPIPYLEYDSDTNCLDISKKIFKIDFDIETYKSMLSSYLFVGDEVPIIKQMEEQVTSICQHIYPLTTTSQPKNSIGDKLKKLLTIK